MLYAMSSYIPENKQFLKNFQKKAYKFSMIQWQAPRNRNRSPPMKGKELSTMHTQTERDAEKKVVTLSHLISCNNVPIITKYHKFSTTHLQNRLLNLYVSLNRRQYCFPVPLGGNRRKPIVKCGIHHMLATYTYITLANNSSVQSLFKSI